MLLKIAKAGLIETSVGGELGFAGKYIACIGRYSLWLTAEKFLGHTSRESNQQVERNWSVDESGDVAERVCGESHRSSDTHNRVCEVLPIALFSIYRFDNVDEALRCHQRRNIAGRTANMAVLRDWRRSYATAATVLYRILTYGTCRVSLVT